MAAGCTLTATTLDMRLSSSRDETRRSAMRRSGPWARAGSSTATTLEVASCPASTSSRASPKTTQRSGGRCTLMQPTRRDCSGV